MQNIKTPGVYIQEISKLPASVAPVATAIPAFVGYTEKRIRGKDIIPVNTPVKIASLLEYEEMFGLPYDEAYEITLSGSSTSGDDTEIAVSPETSNLSPYLMYYHIRMYFANGGGRCYVVSVGSYSSSPSSSSIDPDDLEKGIDALEAEDEPTILVVPETVVLSDSDRGSIYDHMLTQCAKLKDRFAIMDVEENDGPFDDAAAFRNITGMDNLSYGAAYYPSLNTTIRRFYEDKSVNIIDTRGDDDVGPFHGLNLMDLSEGSKYARGEIVILSNDDISVGDIFKVGEDEFEVVDDNPEENQFIKGSSERGTAQNLAIEIGERDTYKAEKISDKPVVLISATEPGEDGEAIDFSFSGSEAGASLSGSGTLEIVDPDTSLYNKIKDTLDKKRLKLYPSGAISGVYARVDRDRGVWKAPANVGLNLVSTPSVKLSDDEQAPLNVHADTGKSINVIRNFHGKGTLVWGARTLAGNDNEWRYIPVRRLFIFIEESIKKATEPVVFEPNDANTWAKTRAMIENFLTGLWRNGALAGATTEDAFFVKVGLGQTMSAIDILEGRLIIEIGIAAVRPAEFIILQFMHKLQES